MVNTQYIFLLQKEFKKKAQRRNNSWKYEHGKKENTELKKKKNNKLQINTAKFKRINL